MMLADVYVGFVIICLSGVCLANEIIDNEFYSVMDFFRQLCVVVTTSLVQLFDVTAQCNINSWTARDDTPLPKSEKHARLISVNNHEGEVKVELDFAVPFLKIPLLGKKSGAHGSLLEPLMELNAKGFVTVATMLFLFVTIIPKVVKLFIPQAYATTTDGLMPLMSRIDEALHTMNMPPTECYQKYACWIGSSSLINISNLANFNGPDWLKNSISKPEIVEALRKGQNGEECSIYKCSLPVEAVNKFIALGRSMLGGE